MHNARGNALKCILWVSRPPAAVYRERSNNGRTALGGGDDDLFISPWGLRKSPSTGIKTHQFIVVFARRTITFVMGRKEKRVVVGSTQQM